MLLESVTMAPGNNDDNVSPADDNPGMELEHAIGYSALSGGLYYHPNGTHLVYAAGGTVVITDLHDPHTQKILTGHDGLIKCIALGNSGRYKLHAVLVVPWVCVLYKKAGANNTVDVYGKSVL